MKKTKPVPEYLQLGYIDNCIEQTMLWMNGKPVHRNNECTLDFSCCYPHMLMADDRRVEVGTEQLNELHERRQKVLSDDTENA